MTARSIATLVRATPQAPTGILHPFPTAELAHIDPFVFLDTGAPLALGDRDIYVGPHAHRGVQPVSLLFRGRIEHRDSLGNDRTVTSGGMQWLVAGSGAFHEEVLNGDDDSVCYMAQLWVNVPAARKADPPERHALGADAVPEIHSLGVASRVRLYAGELAGERGPAPMPTPVLVGHVILEPGGSVSIPVPSGWNAAVCVVDGDSITVATADGTQLLIMADEPIGEPIAMGGGFVMNTSEEIDEAFDDLESGRLGTLVPSR